MAKERSLKKKNAALVFFPFIPPVASPTFSALDPEHDKPSYKMT